MEFKLTFLFKQLSPFILDYYEKVVLYRNSPHIFNTSADNYKHSSLKRDKKVKETNRLGKCKI